MFVLPRFDHHYYEIQSMDNHVTFLAPHQSVCEGHLCDQTDSLH